MSARWLLGSLPLSLLFCTACGGGERDLPPAFESIFGGEPAQEIPNPHVPHERLPQASANFEETECASLVPDRVTQCGVVRVPAAPGSSQILEIAVARVFSDFESPEAEPVVYLSGGPGSSSLEELGTKYGDYASFAPLAPDRDFVFIDQRGVGESKPSLYCREDDVELNELLDTCYAELSQEVELNDFRTINNATDVDLVRRAFGYDKWNLLGVSYGTRLALTIMRDHPEGVRAVLLDSVVPLEANLLPEAAPSGYESLLRVFAACEGDSECNAAFPDLEAKLLQVVQGLNDEPYQGEGYTVEGDLVLGLVFNLLYAPVGIGLVPQLIHDLASDDFSLLELLGGTGTGSTAFGMHLSLQCAEEIPFSTAEDFEREEAGLPSELRAGFSASQYLEYCEHWPVSPAAPSENEAVSSPLPSLVIAGSYDPITPPRYAEQVAANLSQSQLAVIANESHAATVGECGTTLARAFFRAPSQTLALDCLNSPPEFEWFSPSTPVSRQARAPELDFKIQPPTRDELAEIREELERRHSKIGL